MQPDSFATFGDLLKYLRRRARLTQSDLAIAVGYSREQITRLENNQRLPDLATLQALFVPALDTPPAALVVRLLELGGRARATQESTPPIASPAPAPARATNMPGALTSFIGRDMAIAHVLHLLRAHRLVALTGAGGVGKTRLALRVGEQALGRFRDGVWLSELAALSDPDLIPHTVARDLGVAIGGARAPIEAVGMYLADRQLLLILDNCEHLLTACARLAEVWLRAAPGLHILATSRESLGVLSAAAYHVPSLALPPASAAQPDLAAIAESEAVQLFLERAVAVRPEFALSERNADLIAQICGRLDGVPLAIELAATRVRIMAVAHIAARLDDRLALLTGGNRTALPRHQTLRAAIDWSYELLDEAQRAALCRLSVCTNGWSLDAAEALLERSDALDLLTALIDKSLVIVEELDDATRYRLPESIAAYGRSRLAQSGALDSALQQQCRWCLDLARSASVYTPAGQPAPWYLRIEQEHENIRAAFQWALRAEPTSALALVAALWYFWFWRGYWHEGAQWARQALAAAPLARSPERALALVGAGNLVSRSGDHPASIPLFEAAEALADELGDAESIIWARISRGVLAPDEADAYRLLGQAIELAQAGGHDWLLADAHCALGERLRAQGEHERAAACYTASAVIFERIGSAEMLPWPLGNLGRLAAARGSYTQAQAMFQASVASSRAARNQLGVADWSLQLARASLALGDLGMANAALMACLPIYRAVGNLEATADCLVIAAGLSLARGVPSRAAQQIGAADAILERYNLFHQVLDPEARQAYGLQVAQIHAALSQAHYELEYATGRQRPIAESVAAILSPGHPG